MGPTATGKSDLAIELVRRFPLEIISVDSAMIYRGLDIGTAKPSVKLRQEIPHHLIDICDPKEIYSVGRFYQDAQIKIQQIFARGLSPLLVGGTMMYFQALQQGISQLPSADAEVRARLKQDEENSSLDQLYQRLIQVDPALASKISRSDRQRIMRALEVYEITGKPLSVLQQESVPQLLPYDVINLVVVPSEVELLRSRIKKRFEQMLTAGFVDEVKLLYARGDLNSDLPALRSVGYHEVWQYLSNEISYQEMVERVSIATRQLAKRQITWLKKWLQAKRFEVDAEHGKLLDQISTFLYGFF